HGCPSSVPGAHRTPAPFTPSPGRTAVLPGHDLEEGGVVGRVVWEWGQVEGLATPTATTPQGEGRRLREFAPECITALDPGRGGALPLSGFVTLFDMRRCPVVPTNVRSCPVLPASITKKAPFGGTTTQGEGRHPCLCRRRDRMTAASPAAGRRGGHRTAVGPRRFLRGWGGPLWRGGRPRASAAAPGPGRGSPGGRPPAPRSLAAGAPWRGLPRGCCPGRRHLLAWLAAAALGPHQHGAENKLAGPLGPRLVPRRGADTH